MKRIDRLWIGAAAVILVLGGALATAVIGSNNKEGSPAVGVESVPEPVYSTQQEGSPSDAKSKSSRHDAKSGRKPPEHLTPVDIMKRSLESGALEEFTIKQVEEWTVGEPGEVEGELYSIGLVVYKAETIFGLTKVQVKAYIKEGKVERWVYAKTGMEIR